MPLVGLVDQFPRSSTGFVTAPAVLDGKARKILLDQYGIEIDQLNSFHIAATQQPVKFVAPDAFNPHLGFSPVAAIRIDPCTIPFVSQNKSPVEVNGTLNRCGFWLTRTQLQTAAIPTIDYEVRATVGLCTPEVVASGTIKLTDIRQIGLICQVSGILCTQFEFWARLEADGPAAELGIDIVADRFHGQRFEVQKGAIST